MERRGYLAGAGAVLSGSLAGCTIPGLRSVSDTITRSYDVTDETVVAVDNRNGDVIVREASGDQLLVEADRRAGSEGGLDTITVDVVEGERFVIEVRFGGGSGFSNRRADLTVSLPEGVRLDQAATRNGDVTVENVAGDADGVTDNGSVEFRDVDGFVRAETSNGNVTVRNTTGLRGARTSNGRVDVDLLAMDGDVHCQSSNGPVTVRVGPDVAASVRLSTNVGRARVRDLPFEASTDRTDYVVGELRGGSENLLSMETNNGDVTLEPV